jgi:hypothetical protein
MPKEGAMAQLSRPYQVALAAIALLAAVWFLALRGHSGTSGGGASTSPPQQVPAVAPASPYHGSAPGVAGLTRAIEKARGAVAESQANATQLKEKSAQASSASRASSPSSAAAASSTVAVRPSPSAVHRDSTRTGASGAVSPSPRHASATTRQALVEGELKQGRTVIVLFWNRKGADDVAVRGELLALQRNSGLPQDRHIVVHDASAGEVGSFGSFTRAVQVYSTPTILIILPDGKTKTLSGLTDAYAIQQAISEARGA